MTGTLNFREAKPAFIRGLVEARIDPVLFRLSHNYVDDLAETTALIWPSTPLPPPSVGSGLHPAPNEAQVPSPVRERDRVRDAT
ncbi:ATP-dependent DNA ligase, partial [Methylobacterium sp. E-066]|nr:ATP-dependent DNA ligase [Methylobacterium sp. E-066]